ncbi:MAG: hypothetical protein ACR2PR_02550 [Pseudohongiellaceae bacterium]
MGEKKLTTIDQLAAFLDEAQPVAFLVASNKDERYGGYRAGWSNSTTMR